MATLATTTPADSNAEALRALGDDARQGIMQLLIKEELSVTELVEILKLPQSTVSRHLKVLRDAEWLADRRIGTATLYRAAAISPSASSPASPSPSPSASGAQSPSTASDVRQVLQTWLAAQPLAKALASRLERVLQRRTDESSGFFDRLGSRWDQLRSAAFGDAFAFEAMLGLLPREWTVADIGTGTGFLLPSLAARFERVIAVDASPAMLGCAKRRAADAGATNVEFQQGDLGKLPIGDGACDAAIACLVLHHVAKPQEALSELHRILRPGGRALIVEQRAHENQVFYETMQDLWWGFDATGLTEQMSAAGFADVSIMPLHRRETASGRMEAPDLFAISATKSEPSMQGVG